MINNVDFALVILIALGVIIAVFAFGVWIGYQLISDTTKNMIIMVCIVAIAVGCVVYAIMDDSNSIYVISTTPITKAK